MYMIIDDHDCTHFQFYPLFTRLDKSRSADVEANSLGKHTIYYERNSIMTNRQTHVAKVIVQWLKETSDWYLFTRGWSVKNNTLGLSFDLGTIVYSSIRRCLFQLTNSLIKRPTQSENPSIYQTNLEETLLSERYRFTSFSIAFLWSCARTE